MRKTVLLLASMAVALLLASGVALLVAEKPARAAFPGENGRIAFDRNGDIFSMNPDGSGVKRLTDTPARDSDPEYSASGKKIAFTRGPGDRAEIYTMNADGSGVKRLTDNETYDAEPAWSPDGKKIAFTRYNRDRLTEIYKMNADGSGVRRIVKGGCVDCSYRREDYGEEYYTPDWSPDGKKIALGGADFLPCETDRAKNIYTVKPDGSELKRVSDRGRLCYPPDYEPDWSPDGKKIVFYSPGPAGGILTVNRDGSGQKVIYSNPNTLDASYDPAWSPNGERIAFGRSRCVVREGEVREDPAGGPIFPDFDCSDDVYTIKASDGSGLKRITDSPAAWEQALDWQPRPASEPQYKAECKNGGYTDFGFKNQGRCIAFVNRAAHTQ